jgi:hypothetical protein
VKLPPSIRCTKKKHSTGKPCGRWAIRGSTVCPSHGGSIPAVKAKAAKNVEIAQATQASRYFDERRSPWEILMDTGHTSDVLYRLLLDQLNASPDFSPDHIHALNEAIDRAHRLAKVTIDAGLATQLVSAVEDDAQRLYAATRLGVIDSGIDPNGDLFLAIVANVAKRYVSLLPGGGQAAIDGQLAG